MELMSHLITLGVGTSSPDQHADTFDKITELSKELAKNHDYVSVGSQLVGDSEDEEDAGCPEEHLHHDENTLVKVREALKKSLVEEFALGDEALDVILVDMISNMQNAGILFREHRDDEA